MSSSFGGFLQRLFGAGNGSAEATADAPVDYKGYRIVAAPRNEGGQWIVAGTILRDGPAGEQQRYSFVRADSYNSRDGAAEFTVIKARQIIDLEGEAIFNKADAG